MIMAQMKAKKLSLFQQIINNRLLLSSSLMMAVSVISGVLNFLFNIVVSNTIPNQFGIIYPLTSLIMIITIPGLSLQFFMTKNLSILIERKDYATLKMFLRKIIFFVLIIDISLTSLLFILLPFIKSYLHIDKTLALVLVFINTFFMIALIPFNSVIQSRERFLSAGVSQILPVILKFGVGIGIVIVTKSYFGVLWGFLASSIVMFGYLIIDFLSFKPVRAEVKISPDLEFIQMKRIVKSFMFTMLSVGSFQLITYLDSVMVRHFLKAQSGVYSSVNLIGKATFFLANALSFVILPLMAKDKENIRKSNWRGMSILFVVLIGFAFGIAIFSNFISHYIFGGKFTGMERVLKLYSFMFIPYAAISYLVNYYIVLENIIYLLTLLGGGILQIIGITLFHSDLIQVSLVVGGVGYFVLIILILNSLFIGKNISKKIIPEKP